MKDLSVYLHWPFCLSKCPYCDFMSISESNVQVYDKYVDYLLSDLKSSICKIENPLIKTIFFGGGTPSLMKPSQLERFINFLYKNYSIDGDVEITLEANPATFTENKMIDFKNVGINRLSLGIQSFNDKNLKFLGRIYSSKQAIKSAEIVSKCLKNYSFDFIYGYQIQSENDLEADLRLAMSFQCPHISCYQLSFEQNTPFYEKLMTKKISEISEYKSINLFNFIHDLLQDYSLMRYEVSNYALTGFESKHNMAYWLYKDYLGVGPSAHSRLTYNNMKFEIAKFRSICTWTSKIQQCITTDEINKPLSTEEEIKEIFIMGLRLSQGIQLNSLLSKFSQNLLIPIFKKIQILKEQGFFCLNTENIKLSEKGLLTMNSVLDFLFE